jgi:choice-of-anchor B domain-containing protein
MYNAWVGRTSNTRVQQTQSQGFVAAPPKKHANLSGKTLQAMQVWLIFEQMKARYPMNKICLFFLLLCSTTGLFAQDSLNMVKLGQVTFPDILADVQAYVAPNGDEYALVGHFSGVGIVSLVNPSAPVLLHDIPGINTIWREIETFGTYAYVTNEGGDGLRIIDLSGLPGSYAFKDTIMDSIATGHTLYIDDTVLYIYGTQTDFGASIYSLDDPWNPSRLGQYNTQYIHDGYVRDHIGYMGEIYAGLLTIVDLNDPVNPVVLGSVITPDAFTHNAWLNDAGTVCFTTDEIHGAWVTAYDVTDPTNITEIDRIQPSYAEPGTIPHNVKVINDFLVTAHYYDGVHLVDASRPHNLVEVGFYDTSILSPPTQYDGVWGADPYYPSGIIIGGDRQNGLYILDPTYLRACHIEGTVTDAATGLPIFGATVTVAQRNLLESTAPDGTYATGTVTPGVVQVHFHQVGYRDSIVTTTLVNGVLTLLNIPLQPLQRKQLTITVLASNTGLPVANAKIQAELTTSPFNRIFSTNSSGIAVDTSFIPGNYHIAAGLWGYQSAYLGSIDILNDTSITLMIAPGYQDEFVLDLGWSTNSFANTGGFVREEPKGTQAIGSNFRYNPEVDLGTDNGDRCYVTGNTGITPDDDDVDNGYVVLESPVMDLSGYNQPILSYYRWFASKSVTGQLGGDTVWFEIDNGITTALLRRQTTNLNAWVRDTFQLVNFISPTANMRFRMTVKEKIFDNIVEAGLDLFKVVDALPTATAPIGTAAEASLAVAPNPMSAHTMVAYDLGTPRKVSDASFQVHDLAGKLIYQQPLTEPAGAFELEFEAPAGLYLGSIRVQGRVLRSVRIAR